MFNKIKIADIVTVLNALCGLTAILLSFSVFTPLIPVLILIAAVFDGADGYLARKLGASKMGETLDSLADIISFGIAPAVIIFSIYPANIILIISLYLFVSCGILRLARFGSTEKSDSFEGLPITAAGVTLASFTLLKFYQPCSTILILLTIVLALLMISSIPFPKIRNKKAALLLFFIFLLVIITSLASIYAPLISLIFFALLCLYLISPFANLIKSKK